MNGQVIFGIILRELCILMFQGNYIDNIRLFELNVIDLIYQLSSIF